MTITAQVPRVKIAGNGSTFTFNFPFLIPSDTNGGSSYCEVWLLDTTVSPNVMTQLLTNQFSVSGLDNATGGSVTYPLGGTAIPTGKYIIIMRNIPYDQPTAFPNQGFYPENVETSEDWLSQQIQQIEYLLGQTPQAPASDGPMAALPLAEVRSNFVAGFDATGNLINGVVTLAQIAALASQTLPGTTTGTFPTTTALLAAFGAAISLPNGATYVTGARTTVGDGGGGCFRYDSTDLTSADNGGTVRVDGQGRRWKYSGNQFLAALFGFGPLSTAAANTTALTNACAARTTAGTGEVLLPPGTSQIDTTAAPIAVGANALVGDGTNSSTQIIDIGTGTGASLNFQNLAGDFNIRGVNHRSFYLTAPNKTGGYAIYAKWMGNFCQMNNVQVSNCGGGGIHLDGCFDFAMRSCEISSNAGIGVLLDQASGSGGFNELFDSCVFSHNVGDQVRIAGAGNHTFLNCDFSLQGTTGDGIHATSGQGIYIRECYVEGLPVSTSGHYGFHFTDWLEGEITAYWGDSNIGSNPGRTMICMDGATAQVRIMGIGNDGGFSTNDILVNWGSSTGENFFYNIPNFAIINSGANNSNKTTVFT